MKDYLYLDYAANTPVDEEVLKTFNNATLKYFANPNATHGLCVEVNEKIIKTTDEIINLFKENTCLNDNM